MTDQPIPRLRPYQEQHVRRIWEELSYRTSTADVLATGGGKTHIMAASARIHLAYGGERVYVLAPRDELLGQARRTLLEWLPQLRDGFDVGLEQGPNRAHDGHRIVLASLQTMTKARARRAPRPSLVISDEAHLHFARLTDLFKLWKGVPRIGFTATPDRLDGSRLVPGLFESIAAVTELGELVDLGFLVPPVDLEGNTGAQRLEVDSIELDGIACDSAGDFQREALSRMMRQPENVAAAAEATIAYQGDRPTVVFAVDVVHAELLAQEINRRKPDSARAIDGYMTGRRRAGLQAAFMAGKYQTIVAVMLLAYGWDCPPVSCIVCARPTTSRALYSQQIGRGLRTHAASGKEDCLVLDLVGNTTEHRLVTPGEVLEADPDWQPTELPEGHEADEEDTALEALEPTAEDLEALADQEREREEKAARDAAALERLADASISFRMSVVADQLEPIAGEELPERQPDEKPASPVQLAALRALEVDVGLGDGLGEIQAAHVLEVLEGRESEGLCTVRQSRLLLLAGLNPHAKKEDASKAIELLRTSRWRTARIFEDLPAGVLYSGDQALSIRRRVSV